MQQLYSALLEVQREAPRLQRDSINPHFKSQYISLETLMQAVMPVLNKHGLVWITKPCVLGEEEEHPGLSYELVHAETGTQLMGTMPLMLDKQHSQGLGSAITYARRYALMAVLGLVADHDDDGNQASTVEAPRRTTYPPRRTKGIQNDGSVRVASDKQRGLIRVRAREAEMTEKELGFLIAILAKKDIRLDEADKWLERNFEKLPAELVDGILKEIEEVKSEETVKEVE